MNSHEGMQNNPNIKFRSFVCCGLNHRHLGEWVRVLTDDSETMGKFYESWAFVLKKEVGAVRHVTRTPPPPAVATTHHSPHCRLLSVRRLLCDALPVYRHRAEILIRLNSVHSYYI